ncbi:MAG: hypothetical protein ACI4MJ_09175 [Aristaeellaceae bacterium]
MLKLVKYEFRKSLTSLLVLLGLTAGLEGYFLVAMQMNKEQHLLIAMMLLMVCTYAVAAYVFVRGVTAYSGELKSRTSYLLFMTPHSTMAIIGSKFLYTFVNGLFFAVLYGGLGLLDMNLMLARYERYDAFWGMAQKFMLMYGIHVEQIGLGILAVMLYIFLEVLSVIALAYLAITLSHTLLRDRKGRGLVAVGIFGLLSYLISLLGSLFPSALDTLVIYDGQAVGEQVMATFQEVLMSMVPAACISAATIVLSWLGCSWMLEKKVSL